MTCAIVRYPTHSLTCFRSCGFLIAQLRAAHPRRRHRLPALPARPPALASCRSPPLARPAAAAPAELGTPWRRHRCRRLTGVGIGDEHGCGGVLCCRQDAKCLIDGIFQLRLELGELSANELPSQSRLGCAHAASSPSAFALVFLPQRAVPHPRRPRP